MSDYLITTHSYTVENPKSKSGYETVMWCGQYNVTNADSIETAVSKLWHHLDNHNERMTKLVYKVWPSEQMYCYNGVNSDEVIDNLGGFNED